MWFLGAVARMSSRRAQNAVNQVSLTCGAPSAPLGRVSLTGNVAETRVKEAAGSNGGKNCNLSLDRPYAIPSQRYNGILHCVISKSHSHVDRAYVLSPDSKWRPYEVVLSLTACAVAATFSLAVSAVIASLLLPPM